MYLRFYIYKNEWVKKYRNQTLIININTQTEEVIFSNFSEKFKLLTKITWKNLKIEKNYM